MPASSRLGDESVVPGMRWVAAVSLRGAQRVVEERLISILPAAYGSMVVFETCRCLYLLPTLQKSTKDTYQHASLMS